MGEKIENGTIQIGEIIGKTLDGKDIYKFTELGIAENVKIIAPQYKDGDFVVPVDGVVLIFKKKVGDFIYDHAYYTEMLGEVIFSNSPYRSPIERYATETEKQELLNALAKAGKRWNEEKKCIEDIPKRKFQKGDKVRIKAGVSSKTHRDISPGFIVQMDDLIGKELTVEGYGNLFVKCDGYYFSEDWLEPYEELKKGDLAIFWDDGGQHRASVRIYGSLFTHDYLDTGGVRWDNAIKFESKEQFEKLINGEL
ncbi:MAG: hypothetical protein PHX50_17710 [Massilibacteroides sp.]|nr:hypothetical protein [Massilibacteroides sp.]